MEAKERQITAQVVLAVVPKCPSCGDQNYRFTTTTSYGKQRMAAASCTRCDVDILEAARARLGW